MTPPAHPSPNRPWTCRSHRLHQRCPWWKNWALFGKQGVTQLLFLLLLLVVVCCLLVVGRWSLVVGRWLLVVWLLRKGIDLVNPWSKNDALQGVSEDDDNGDFANAIRSGELYPRKLTWNLKMNPWKRRFLSKTIIFRFHVSFRESYATSIIQGKTPGTHEKQPLIRQQTKNKHTSSFNLPNLGFCQEKHAIININIRKKKRKWRQTRSTCRKTPQMPPRKEVLTQVGFTVLEPPTSHWNFVFCIRIWILCIMRKFFDNFLQIRNKSPTTKKTLFFF